MAIRPATDNDVPALARLVNSAYRGEFSKKGWTSEADLLVGGVRIDEEELLEMLHREKDAILVEESAGEIRGCVHLVNKGEHVYLGLLTVNPLLQAGGIGKNLMTAAEAWTRQQQLKSIQLTVITARIELVAWYERRGYRDTGTRKPYPYRPATGEPSQPIVFMLMEKRLD
ncbi:putative acetyltransferase [Flavihumibacter petaseus NBRC 106054]|uniref:Putative acetyltransferase n=1 Tax=Flavihumibacter petaseus NBRC 106054 TaxID=1220578 RepID=A0A0E9MX98_9BACT|nr:GNAT family N-acetyltransferase [Flavihumibacter petaseus]GAO41745.1 putative acetyltransferase [Flavihumibacter petaseus NBRC 106054]